MEESKKYLELEEEPIENSEINIPFDPKKVDISIEQTTLEQLASRIKYDEIDLMPEFQRQGNLWTATKMSLLIESLLIKLPLPAFYFDVSNEDKWIVVDGLQRLCTIQRFIVKGDLYLKGLEFLTQLEGKSFSELDRSFQRRLNETNITVFKIKKGTPKEVLTSLFHRINTGGMKLTAQEIRHALNQGQASHFLKNIAESELFKSCLKVSPQRMLDKELIVRFMAFYRNNYLDYKPSLQQFLDKEMSYLNQATTTSADLDDLQQSFFRSLNISKKIFSRKMFSKALIDQKKHIVINRSLFEATTVNFARLSDKEESLLLEYKEAFLADYILLMKNKDFEASITANTNHIDMVIFRHKHIQEIISKYTKHAY